MTTLAGGQSGSLLRIDFNAALDKMAWSQLQGPWQLPAELARLAIGSGARSVELEVTKSRLVLEAAGARLERSTVSDFASLLDTGLEASERHRAMVALEERDAVALAAIACSEVEALTLRTGAEGLRLEFRAGGDLRVVPSGGEEVGQSRLQLSVAGFAMDVERASTWLRRVARFAPVPVTLAGRRVDRGFDKSLVTGRFEASPRSKPSTRETTEGPPKLSVSLAISRRGNAPRLWLLRHGIVATRATVPSYPAFEAAVEMAPVAGSAETSPSGSPRTLPAATGVPVPPALLRERLGPYVGAIVDAAVGLTIRLGQNAETLSEGVRERVGRLLLEAARKRRRLAEVSGVEIFPMVRATESGESVRRLVSLDEISRSVRIESGGVSALDAIPPGQDPAALVLSGRGALQVSQSERALLGDQLCAVFSAPPARRRRRLGHRLLETLADGAAALARGRGRPITEAALTPVERSFLARVQTADDVAPRVVFRGGGGRPHLASDGVLHLPRASPAVRDAVRAVAADPAWVYPALVCLSGGRALLGPGCEARRAWLSSVRSHDPSLLAGP